MGERVKIFIKSRWSGVAQFNSSIRMPRARFDLPGSPWPRLQQPPCGKLRSHLRSLAMPANDLGLARIRQPWRRIDATTARPCNCNREANWISSCFSRVPGLDASRVHYIQTRTTLLLSRIQRGSSLLSAHPLFRRETRMHFESLCKSLGRKKNPIQIAVTFGKCLFSVNHEIGTVRVSSVLFVYYAKWKCKSSFRGRFEHQKITSLVSRIA